MAETNKPPEAPDRCRLTILDLLLLMFSYAVGFGTSRSLCEQAAAGNVALPWHAAAMAMDVAFWGVVFGSAVAVPTAVISQWALRRRKIWISLGEWIWIMPTLVWIVAFAASNLPGGRTPSISAHRETSLVFAVLCQIAFSIGAALLLGLRFGTGWQGVQCRWTELFGCAVCAALGAFAVYSMITNLIKI